MEPTPSETSPNPETGTAEAPRTPGPTDPRASQPGVSTSPTAQPQRPSIRTDPLLSCLAFLRYELGTHWSGVMEPFSVDPKDALAVNEASKRLASHAGLRDLTFIVGIGRDGPETGGQVELTTGQDEVFIEVSKEAGAFGPSLVAVLAHEISHKVLFDRLIHQQGDDERLYELLTDVTAVYLGFGKLLLNGYEYTSSKPGSAAGERSKRHVRLGYLRLDEVAFVHAMACCMRELRTQDWYLGLSPYARRTMSRVVHDDDVRRLLDTAATLRPQKSYLRPPRRSTVVAPDGAARHASTGPAGDGDRHSRSYAQPPGASPPTHASPRHPTAPTTKATRTPASPPSTSQEVTLLHDQLLTLVYGDTGLVRRLVEFERRRNATLEASYRAAIARLLRDRA